MFPYILHVYICMHVYACVNIGVTTGFGCIQVFISVILLNIVLCFPYKIKIYFKIMIEKLWITGGH